MHITSDIHWIDRKLSREVAPARPALVRRLAISAAAAHHTSSLVEDGCGVELGDLLLMAVELNRNAAQQRNVRIHCYVLDQSLELERKDVLLVKLDTLLGRAVQNAHWGSPSLAKPALKMTRPNFTSASQPQLALKGRPHRGSIGSMKYGPGR